MATKTRLWERQYARMIGTSDLVVVLFAVFGAQTLRFGADQQELAVRVYERQGFATTYSFVSLALALVWTLALGMLGSRDPKTFGTGVDEYRSVAWATFATFGTLAIVAFSSRSQVGRGYVFIAFPAGLLLLLLTRLLWRKWLQRKRKHKEFVYRTLVVGDRAKSEHVAKQIMTSHANGLWVVGAVTEHGTPLNLLREIQVVAGYEKLLDIVDELEVDTLVMTSADAIEPDRMREIGWGLDERHVNLVVAAALTDVAGPRIHTRPISGLPLIHVGYPQFSGRKRFAKRIFDIIGSVVLIVLTSPIMLAVALAVGVTSKGPIFYSQQRIGLNNKSFPMFKFRSMIQNADDQLKSLLDLQGSSDKPLHKVENDPRITPVGRFIRKYSLDELPQFFNVFLGTMTLVGPRPQREAEVALYESHHYRRLLVKPGITGLWQVSGRSDIDWEDAIRLDLYYVENWSLFGDLVLLARTVKTVIMPEGAH